MISLLQTEVVLFFLLWSICLLFLFFYLLLPTELDRAYNNMLSSSCKRDQSSFVPSIREKSSNPSPSSMVGMAGHCRILYQVQELSSIDSLYYKSMSILSYAFLHQLIWICDFLLCHLLIKCIIMINFQVSNQFHIPRINRFGHI